MGSGQSGMSFPRIHITGASGAGVTSLGSVLAERLKAFHFDIDDFYWLPTSPPHRLKREVPERLAMLRDAGSRRDRALRIFRGRQGPETWANVRPGMPRTGTALPSTGGPWPR